VKGGKSFGIAARAGARQQRLDVFLTPGLDQKYRVEQKEIPAGLPTTWTTPSGETRSVTWVNNFGLKEKGKTRFVAGEVSEHYEIQIDREEGKTLVYYSGGVKYFDAKDLGSPPDAPGKISARLKLGDPPVGWT
jgi:hypothetical protein